MNSLPYERLLDILLSLDVEDIINFCQTDRFYANVCQDWTFWSEKPRLDLKLPRGLFYQDNFGPVRRYLYIRNLLIQPITSLKRAIKADNVDAVRILLQYVDPRERMGENRDQPVVAAARYGSVKVLNLLLNDQRVDPSIRDDIALLIAIKNGHTEAANILLDDPRVNPANMNNEAIYDSIEAENYEIVARLLGDSRVDPRDDNNILTAVETGNMPILELLLADNRIDPTILNNYPVRIASMYGNIDAMDRLLRDPRLHRDSDKRYLYLDDALARAAGNGHLNIVNRLLEEPNINPSNWGNLALKNAAKNRHLEVALRLLQDPRINNNVDKDELVRIFKKNGWDIPLTQYLFMVKFNENSRMF